MVDGKPDYLCRACFTYAALHVGAAALLCLHLAVTSILTERREAIALTRLTPKTPRGVDPMYIPL